MPTTHMATTSFTRVGNSADSPEPSLRRHLRQAMLPKFSTDTPQMWGTIPLRLTSSRGTCGKETTVSEFLGVVHEGQFQPLAPESAVGVSLQLSRLSMRMADPPESDMLDLSPYEGKAIVIQGDGHGGWIYSSQVIDTAGPILTMVVQRVFGKGYRSA
jgi:hypothetical protein